MAEEKETPITTNSLIKWGGFILALVGGFTTLVVWASKTGYKVESLEGRVAEVDKESASRHERQAAEIQELKARNASTDKTVYEMGRKLDVAVAILERIEKKLP